MKGIMTIIQYLTTGLIQTLDHPSKTMENEEMYSFLRGVLQIYLEFWNSTQPPFDSRSDVPNNKRTSTTTENSNLQNYIFTEAHRMLPILPTCQQPSLYGKTGKTELRPHFTSTRLLQPNNLEIALRLTTNELLIGNCQTNSQLLPIFTHLNIFQNQIIVFSIQNKFY